jgi:hypothetical protein
VAEAAGFVDVDVGGPIAGGRVLHQGELDVRVAIAALEALLDLIAGKWFVECAGGRGVAGVAGEEGGQATVDAAEDAVLFESDKRADEAEGVAGAVVTGFGVDVEQAGLFEGGAAREKRDVREDGMEFGRKRWSGDAADVRRADGQAEGGRRSGQAMEE